MNTKWTRRRFLELVKRSMIAGGGTVLTLSHAHPAAAAASHSTGPATTGFDSKSRRLLKAVADEIIPAGDGMPACSEAGGIEYLDKLAKSSPSIKRELQKSLQALVKIVQAAHGRAFEALSSEQRVEVLKKFESQPEPQLFATLRDYVYESYYLQPEVWKKIGYEFHPTNQAGPAMKPFDEALLAKVRAMPKLYREAPDA
jgi:hypothetical protein